MKDKGKIVLLIVIAFLLISDVVFLYWAKHFYIKNITLSFYASTKSSNTDDLIDMELKDGDLKEFKSLIKKIDYKPCKCISADEFILNVDSKYSLIFGKVGNDYVGIKKDFENGKTKGPFKVPKELYEKSISLANRYKQE